LTGQITGRFVAAPLVDGGVRHACGSVFDDVRVGDTHGWWAAEDASGSMLVLEPHHEPIRLDAALRRKADQTPGPLAGPGTYGGHGEHRRVEFGQATDDRPVAAVVLIGVRMGFGGSIRPRRLRLRVMLLRSVSAGLARSLRRRLS